MSDFEIVSKDAEVDACYGLEAFYITKDEIAALLSGKKLYSTVNCDEYAITIEMKEDAAKEHDCCLWDNHMNKCMAGYSNCPDNAQCIAFD